MNELWKVLIKIKTEFMAWYLDENLDGSFPRKKKTQKSEAKK
jgi:hypothetical protein